MDPSQVAWLLQGQVDGPPAEMRDTSYMDPQSAGAYNLAQYLGVDHAPNITPSFQPTQGLDDGDEYNGGNGPFSNGESVAPTSYGTMLIQITTVTYNVKPMTDIDCQGWNPMYHERVPMFIRPIEDPGNGAMERYQQKLRAPKLKFLTKVNMLPVYYMNLFLILKANKILSKLWEQAKAECSDIVEQTRYVESRYYTNETLKECMRDWKYAGISMTPTAPLSLARVKDGEDRAIVTSCYMVGKVAALWGPNVRGSHKLFMVYRFDVAPESICVAPETVIRTSKQYRTFLYPQWATGWSVRSTMRCDEFAANPSTFPEADQAWAERQLHYLGHAEFVGWCDKNPKFTLRSAANPALYGTHRLDDITSDMFDGTGSMDASLSVRA